MTAVSDETGRELKPCPFCGGPATLGGLPKGIIGQVYCRNDDCFGPKTTAMSKADSIIQWNKRATLSASPVAQEPVAWRKRIPLSGHLTWVYSESPSFEPTYEIQPLYTSPPATPAGVGADEIARALAFLISEIELEFSRNKAKAFPADPQKKNEFTQCKAILALLSRAGDQSNSTHEEQSTQNI